MTGHLFILNMSNPKALEKLESQVKNALYKLSDEQLRNLCTHLKIADDTEAKQHHGLVKHINRHLDSPEVEQQPDNGKALLEELNTMMKEMLGPAEEPTSTTHNELKAALDLAASMNRKDFRIHGQIGAPGQADKLIFQSLIRQVGDGLKKKYKPSEVINGVIRAISYMPLREMLEGRQNLTLAELRRILRSHFNEKDALTSY